MMLSVLIPVYNWDVSSLLGNILREIDESALGGAVEVILMDDCSTDARILARNSDFLAGHARPYLRVGTLQRNAGRAAIRNMLAADASGEFLLFLDCDILPDSSDFIKSYLSLAKGNSFDVVCGGISYRTRVLNGSEFDYHAYLGNRKEVKPAAERNREPWRFILTSNIMVRKSVFEGTPFNEEFTGYGYEDIEWGVRLAQKFRILHIDNSASHLGLVTKAKAYEKMRNSVPNYLLLKRLHPAAFGVSTISKLVQVLQPLNYSLLKFFDARLRGLFLRNGLSNKYAFVLFQLNFAVLLALATRDTRQHCS